MTSVRAFAAALAALAALAAPALAFSAGAAPVFVFEQKMFKARLPEGFHFNAQAPNAADADGARLEPAKVAGREADFELPKADFRSLKAQLYVCDDANTYCEPRAYAFGPGGKSLGAAPPPAVAPAPSAGGDAKVNKYGFYEDDFDRALADAKEKGSLALLDFSARWCPGCLRLETEGFATPAFQLAARSFAKVRLDSDRFENGALRERYRVLGIPALIIVNAEGQEIARLIDYQPVARLSAFLKDARRNPITLDELKAKAATGDARAARTAGRRLADAHRFTEAIELYDRAKDRSPEYWIARVKQIDEDPARKVELPGVLRQAIAALPASTLSLAWRARLASLDASTEEERARLASDGEKLTARLLAKPSRIRAAAIGDNLGEYIGLEPLFVAEAQAVLAENAKRPEEEVAAASKRMADVARKLRVPPKRRGPALRVLVTYAHAKEWREAEEQARAMLKVWPKDPEIERRLAAALNRQSKHAEAIEAAEIARSDSYGANDYYNAVELAKAYVGAGRSADARALVTSYLGRSEINEKSLKKQKDELEKIQSALPTSSTLPGAGG